MSWYDLSTLETILVPRGRAPFGQHQESRPLAKSNTGSPRFTDFPSLCACSESSLTNLIGSGLNLLCLQSHSKTECRWTRPEVAILGDDQKESGSKVACCLLLPLYHELKDLMTVDDVDPFSGYLLSSVDIIIAVIGVKPAVKYFFLFRKAHKRGERVNTKQNWSFHLVSMSNRW